MKAVQLLVNSYLPEDMRNYGNKYDTKDINKILVAVARKHPEKYAEVEKKLSDIGRTASYLQGATISLKDLEPVIDKNALFADMDKEIAALPKDEHFTERRREIFNKYRNTAGKMVAERALKNRNNIAMAVLSGARGKNDQLAAMIFSPFQYSDYKGEPVDVISRSSFAEGINPTVFLASTNGSRASVVSAKCLAHDTLVRMADLSERKICDIKPGEQVLGADREGHVFPVKVLNVFYQGEKECFAYRFDCVDGDTTIIATEDHKMLTERAVEPLSVVEEEEVPVVDSEGCKGTLMSKKGVGMIHCFDIEVDHPDHLFVLANGLITSNSSTAKGGDIAKQFAASTADLTVRQEDCHTSNGIALDIDDKSLKGRALAQDVGGYKAGSFINADMLSDLRKKGVKNVVARSALTCRADGGLCAHCVGKFFHGGKLPKVGDSVGLMASTSISEPVTQMALSAKHSAGMTKDKKSYSGIPALQQFTQSPEKYKDRAVVSELDGVVDAIEPADQGGTYITVSGKKHYIQPGHDPEVKVGDKVEAGDFLSEGLPDIEDTVRLKGLGAGRKLYATRLNQLLSDSGVKADPRNTEIIARGALRHVVVKGADGFGDYEPDDVIDYEVAEQSYKMPETTQAMKPTAAVGKYLQAPFLHYTVGTRITPNVAKDLESNGYNTVYADTKTPEFEPEMVRLRTASHTTRDWLASLGTSYLTKQLQDSATRGDDTNILHNKDYRPRLAYGVGFGQNIEETGEF